MQQLTILQIIRGLDIGGDSGGAERFGVELARALKRAGQNVSICAFFRVGTETERQWQHNLQAEGIPTFFLTDWGGVHNLKQYLRGLAVLRARLRGARLDVVHSHFQLGSLTALLLKLAGKTRAALRTAHIRREWELGKNGWLLNTLFIRWLFPLLLDAEVGVSQAIVDYLATHSGAKVARRAPRLIHNAVSYETMPDPAAAPEQLPKDPRGFDVISVGRLSEQKGYEFLLDAVPQVLQSLPQTTFWIAGDGELRDSLAQQARALGIAGSVRFLGLRMDVPHLLPQCDLFVLSSLWEGFPTVIMESMVSETPVIATDIPGTRELVRDGVNGWLVPPRDPQRLAQAITHALRHPQQRADVAAAARQHVKAFFIDNICQEYLHLYAQICRLRS